MLLAEDGRPRAALGCNVGRVVTYVASISGIISQHPHCQCMLRCRCRWLGSIRLLQGPKYLGRSRGEDSGLLKDVGEIVQLF